MSSQKLPSSTLDNKQKIQLCQPNCQLNIICLSILTYIVARIETTESVFKESQLQSDDENKLDYMQLLLMDFNNLQHVSQISRILVRRSNS